MDISHVDTGKRLLVSVALPMAMLELKLSNNKLHLDLPAGLHPVGNSHSENISRLRLGKATAMFVLVSRLDLVSCLAFFDGEDSCSLDIPCAK